MPVPDFLECQTSRPSIEENEAPHILGSVVTKRELLSVGAIQPSTSKNEHAQIVSIDSLRMDQPSHNRLFIVAARSCTVVDHRAYMTIVGTIKKVVRSRAGA